MGRGCKRSLERRGEDRERSEQTAAPTMHLAPGAGGDVFGHLRLGSGQPVVCRPSADVVVVCEPSSGFASHLGDFRCCNSRVVRCSSWDSEKFL